MAKTVMVVDDSEFTRNLLKSIILDAGADEVVEASDGAEAIKKYAETKPDLVLMDMVMPNVTGNQALKEIIEYDNDAKIIIYTSSDQQRIIKEVLEAGAIDIVTKPLIRDDVLALLDKYL